MRTADSQILQSISESLLGSPNVPKEISAFLGIHLSTLIGCLSDGASLYNEIGVKRPLYVMKSMAFGMNFRGNICLFDLGEGGNVFG